MHKDLHKWLILKFFTDWIRLWPDPSQPPYLSVLALRLAGVGSWRRGVPCLALPVGVVPRPPTRSPSPPNKKPSEDGAAEWGDQGRTE